MDRRKFLKSTSASLLALTVPETVLFAFPNDTLNQALSRIAEQALGDLAVPGVQISVWENGVRVSEVARGLSNLETATPVTAATIFRAGSITKQFTAALVAKLQDQGQLSVHDGVEKYLGFFKSKDTPTLLELIHHTAGVHTQNDERCSLSHTTQIDLAKEIAAQEVLLDFSPGTAWLYSNANYILLGAVIESVTKQPLAQAAKQLIFDPLDLGRTRFDDHSEIIHNRASGYTGTTNRGTPFLNADFIPIEQTGGAGAIRTTADDLCLWHHTLLYGNMLSSAARKALIEPATLRDGRPVTRGRFDPRDSNMGDTSYGYGLMLDSSAKNQGVIAMHYGFVSGFSAYLATHVPSRLTVACLCNADPGPNLPFRALRKTVFSRYL